jgi:hypothetical protein
VHHKPAFGNHLAVTIGAAPESDHQAISAIDL